MIEVVAGIIYKDDKFLIAQRNLKKAQGGLWEFPGGKIEPGEKNEDALKREIREEFKILPLEFIYDKFVDQYKISDPNTIEIRKSTKEEIIGLEKSAVWPGNCIEDRIRDHYEGKICIWVKSMYGEIFENYQELYG